MKTRHWWSIRDPWIEIANARIQPDLTPIVIPDDEINAKV